MSDCHDAYLGNVRCDCGETINPGSPYVEVQPGGVLWHGNAQGGGHASNFESKRAPRTPDFRDLLRRDLLRYCKGRGLPPSEAEQRAAELLEFVEREAARFT